MDNFLIYAIMLSVNLTMLLGCLICALIVCIKNEKRQADKPTQEMKKVTTSPSFDKGLEDMVKQLDYMTARGVSPEIAQRVVRQVNSADKLASRDAESQIRLNKLLNSLLQHAAKGN